MTWWVACLGCIWTPISDALVSCINGAAVGCLTWVWNRASREITSVVQLDSMTEDLDREMRYLMGAREDMVAGVKRGALHNQVPTFEAKIWMEEVQELETEAGRFREDKVSQQNTGFSLISCRALSSQVRELLKEVERLKTRKATLVVFLCEARPDSISLQSVPIHSIVGIDDTLSDIYRWLDDDDSQIVGLYGMGGIGKTALLKTINNELFRTKSGGFDLVMFVEVSRDFSIDNIQDDIAGYLGYSSSFDQNVGRKLPQDLKGRSIVLRKNLFEKKFLLLLDDLWAKVDLEKVGVPVYPYTKKGSKIIFTTRSIEVCIDMGAAHQRIKLNYLSEEHSWKLFCECVGRGEDQWTDSTRLLAKTVAFRCGGLPLALFTVSRAMASATTLDEWEEAVRMLGGIPVEIRNMEEEVLNLLKFSFDSLKDEYLRESLLYCCLFPYGWNISISELISDWRAEGFLDEESHPLPFNAAFNRGLRIISALKAVSLLEEGSYGEFVKLHDTVRQMLCWMTSSVYSANKNIFFADFGAGLQRAPSKERWREATRISLMNSSISELPLIPECPNSRTLILQNNPSLSHVDGGFFQFMLLLTVSDLSQTGITHLPPEIGLLARLGYLNLSYTNLESLPKEIGRLKILKQLDLILVNGLKSIPREAFSSLSCFQSLNAFLGSYTWLVERNDDYGETEVRLKDLEGLMQLDFFGFNLDAISQEHWQLIQNSHKLCMSTRCSRLSSLDNSSSSYFTKFLEVIKDLNLLSICDSPELDHLKIPTNHLSQLEYLCLKDLPKAVISLVNGDAFSRERTEGVLASLSTLIIDNCEMLEKDDITWIKGLPSLKRLMLKGIPKIVELIETDIDHEGCPFFLELAKLDLFHMPNLEFICRKPLSLPSLERIKVVHCHKLKKLPFELDSAKSIKIINGSQEWWDNLEWDRNDIRSKFSPYFAKR